MSVIESLSGGEEEKSQRMPVPLLDPDHLRSFVAVAETGNLTRAADAVFRTPSAVSMQIKKLEETLGKPVLFRTSREVSLTPDGEEFLAYARRLLALNREAVLQFRKPEVEGTVRIGAPDDYGARLLPNVLKRFSETYPGVVVDVVIDLSVQLVKRFKRRELDIVLTSCDPFTQTPMRSEVVLEEQLVWVGLKGGCAHMQRPLPLSMWEAGCPWRTAATAGLERIGVPYRSAFVSAHSTGQRAALLSDLAVAPFPRSLIEPPIVELSEEETGLPPLNTYTVTLSWHDDLGDASQLAVDTIIEEFRDLPDNLLSPVRAVPAHR